MITVEKLRALKAQYPGCPVVCYVNTTADIKAESDICCTSANAAKVVLSLPDIEIIFIPDKYLGLNTQALVPDRKLILFEGYCPTHMRILPEHIKRAKVEHPAALVLVHPECRPEVAALADAVLSTGGMSSFVREAKAAEFIVATEIGMVYCLEKANPSKKIYPASPLAVCPNMKLTSLEKVLWSLEDLQTEITVPDAIRLKAKKAIDGMLAVGR